MAGGSLAAVIAPRRKMTAQINRSADAPTWSEISPCRARPGRASFTMRGDITKDARPGRARHGLISLQVGASALLLICAVIFLRGAMTAAREPPAIRTSDTVRVSVANEPRRAALVQTVMAEPSVALVSSSSPPTD